MPPSRTHSPSSAGASVLTAESLIEVASDPARYAAMLDELAHRKCAAEEAEVIAKDRQAEAEHAEARSKASLGALAERSAALDARKGEIASHNKHSIVREIAMVEAERCDADHEAALAECDAEIVRLRERAISAVRELLQ